MAAWRARQLVLMLWLAPHDCQIIVSRDPMNARLHRPRERVVKISGNWILSAVLFAACLAPLSAPAQAIDSARQSTPRAYPPMACEAVIFPRSPLCPSPTGVLSDQRGAAPVAAPIHPETDWSRLDARADANAGWIRSAAQPAILPGAEAEVTAAMRGTHPVPPTDWNGFYIGAVGGFGFGQAHQSDVLTRISTGWFDTEGPLFGGSLGFNFQRGILVFGIEADIAWSGINGTVACPNSVLACRADLDWFGTARGRLGWSAGVWMPYITGGAAVTDIAVKFAGPGIPPLLPGQTNTHLGWTIGAGIEWAFARNWSAKLDYLYAAFGRETCDATNCGANPVSVRLDTTVLRGGINYRFNWGTPLTSSY